jgi:hypothetical protein
MDLEGVDCSMDLSGDLVVLEMQYWWRNVIVVAGM